VAAGAPTGDSPRIRARCPDWAWVHRELRAAPMRPCRSIADEKLFVGFAGRTGEVVENLSLEQDQVPLLRFLTPLRAQSAEGG
jgi:hypothetical protein